MRVRARFLWAPVAACLLAGGCDDENPAEPSAGLDGTWRGTMTRGAASGTATLQLAQSAAGLTGTWSADLDDAAFDQTGTVSGSVMASTVSLFLQPGAPIVCAPGLTLSGTLAMNGSITGDRLSGDYVVLTCGAADTGRIDVKRQ